MASKLSKLRQGKPFHKIVDISGDVKVAVVIISADEVRAIEEAVEAYANQNKDKVNMNVRNQYFDQLLCYHCMRDPENLDAKFADSVNEVAKMMDLEDISRITMAYGELMVNKSPKLELLTEEEFEEIKKNLEATRLSDLNTVSLVHLKNYHQAMHSGQ